MFGRKRSRQNMAKQLQMLTEQVQSLAEQLDRFRRERPGVTIEHMKVDQAYLDELVFRLDSLDIQELSGSLNLGNNFNPKVTHTSVKRPAPVATVSANKVTGNNMAANNSEQSANTGTDAGENRTTTLNFTDGRQMNTTKTGFLVTLS